MVAELLMAIGDWNKAEKDLLNSLQASPDQAYVINYLAYSWIEKGIKIEKSLNMLEKANRLKTMILLLLTRSVGHYLS